VTYFSGPPSKLSPTRKVAQGQIWPDWAGVRVYEPIPLKVSGQKTTIQDNGHFAGDGWLLGTIAETWDTKPGKVADSAMRGGLDWINLLCIHSVGSMLWSDSGHLYLLIRKSNLKKGDFSEVIGTIESS
jgi:hypothetical protein